jgi:large subunit ribosomal protein L17
MVQRIKLGRDKAHRVAMLRCVWCLGAALLRFTHKNDALRFAAHGAQPSTPSTPKKSNSTMVTQLIEHERITTTLARAKQLRKLADRVVTYAKKGDRPARAEAAAVVRTDRELHKLFTTLAGRYADRAGGYTRVLRCGTRRHDAAPMAFIEFVDRAGELRPARPPASASQQLQQQQQGAWSHLPLSARSFLEQEQRRQQQQQQSVASSKE